jgi:hypothetical protein
MLASGQAHYRWRSGGSKLWRRQKALDAAGSSGCVRKLWRRQKALETKAQDAAGRLGCGRKLWIPYGRKLWMR